MIFKSCIIKEQFLSEWKKANVAPVHKKSDKQSLKNYRPISLLPIFGKFFERIIYNNVYEYLPTNKLISDNQSGFKPGDSCVNQLTKTNHPTLIFNDNPVHQVALQKHLGIFLDCKLNFEENFKTIINKINKTIGLLRKY